MSAPGGSMSGVASSFALPLEGLRLLRHERSLWSAAAVPLLLSLVAIVATLAGLVAYAGEIHGFVSGWLPILHADAWFEWLWVAPARGLLWLLGKLLFAAAALLFLVAAFLLASLVAAPFHDALSRRVELVVTGRVEEVEASGVLGVAREAGRAVREELRRLLFLLGLWAALAAFGILIPGGQLLATPAAGLVTVLFLPLDYASYTLDRRRLSFREKRAWLFANVGAALGFGAAAVLVCAVPGLNLLAMPVLVVAGTLLALRHPTGAGSGGAASGTSTSP